MIRDTLSACRLGSICTLTAIAFAALGGCDMRDPRTQVMLVVDADSDVSARVTSLTVEVEGGSASGDSAVSSFSNTFGPMDPSGVSWPYRIALVPRSGDVKRLYHVTATAYMGSDRIAVLRAESGFVARKTIELRLKFEWSCLHAKSLDCEMTETCVKGECLPARIDQGTLPMYGDDAREVDVPESDGGLPPTGTTSGPVMTVGGAGGAAGSGGRVAVGGTIQGGAGAPAGDPSVPGDCGDGKLTGDETCDSAIAAGQPGACPTTCSPSSACEPTQLEGSGCHTRCTPHLITALESGDGCCPPGTDANSDTDCSSRCDNGSIETGEACDPIATCPTAATCVSANACLKATVIGDPTACNATCQMQPILECVSGDGCCPSNCASLNDADCSASCGDGVVDFAAGELCEAQSAERPCPVSCTDNDACTIELFTGSVANCNSVCTEIRIVAPFAGDGCCPSGANANNDTDCQPRCGNRAVERGEKCDGNCPSAADCDDGNPCRRDGLVGSECTVSCTHQDITEPALEPDGCCVPGANANNDGDCQPVCGNGVKEGSEACDDDNTVSGDGCSSRCTIEAPTPVCGNGMREGSEMCDDGNVVSGDGCSSTCTVEAPTPVCGNGMREGSEVCDDGNVVSGDGCSSTCTVEAPTPVCGNGMREGSEMCDDGNVVSGDGCSSTCTIEALPASAGSG